MIAPELFAAAFAKFTTAFAGAQWPAVGTGAGGPGNAVVPVEPEPEPG
jgi:hypothetical protein